MSFKIHSYLCHSILTHIVFYYLNTQVIGVKHNAKKKRYCLSFGVLQSYFGTSTKLETADIAAYSDLASNKDFTVFKLCSVLPIVMCLFLFIMVRCWVNVQVVWQLVANTGLWVLQHLSTTVCFYLATLACTAGLLPIWPIIFFTFSYAFSLMSVFMWFSSFHALCLGQGKG